ncbi:hypothetical protein [Pseudovibrio sp. WM33]|uniref:hypothetical protein n=1 Tax=Pseudovibrio sp. WM33 TaxID=1735585 RepID=UPI0007AEB706|nr:hypothetical protein [Pseudovibrio sp. WM33]KZL28630.1 hypothetical protein PsWM33_00339 [Pseudovibrio sp. WM33]
MKRVLLFAVVYCLFFSVAFATCSSGKDISAQHADMCTLVQGNLDRVAAALAAEELCRYTLSGYEKSRLIGLLSRDLNRDLNDLVQMFKRHGKSVKFFPQERIENPTNSDFCLMNTALLEVLGLEVNKED